MFDYERSTQGKYQTVLPRFLVNSWNKVDGIFPDINGHVED